jgi:hypothetical protein
LSWGRGRRLKPKRRTNSRSQQLVPKSKSFQISSHKPVKDIGDFQRALFELCRLFKYPDKRKENNTKDILRI